MVAHFQVGRLLDSSGDVRVYRGRDDLVDRAVLLRVAGSASADALLEDARRLSVVSAPGLVAVLEAGRGESGAYAVVQDVDALPLAQAGPLSPEHAARVGIDVAGAIAALADAGLRAPIDASTVLVVQAHDGVRGLLDPMRGSSPGQSCMSASDPVASTAELAGLLEGAAGESGAALRNAIAEARSGTPNTPAGLAAALAPLAAPARRASGRRRPALTAAAGLVLVVIAVAVIAHERSGGSTNAAAGHTPAPARVAPAARIVARIQLGLTGNEFPAGYAAIGHTLWIATSNGRLLRVDATTNQMAGSPIDLGKKHSFWSMATIGGKLYTTEIAGWLLRIDPQTGRITGRRHLAGELTFIKAVDGVLWVIGTPLGLSTGTLMRVDPGTLRVIGKPVKAIARPVALEVRGSVAWMLGGASSGELARVDVRSGARKLVNVGPNPTAIALSGDRIWETDRFDGTLAALDARSLRFGGDVVHTPRAAYGVLATGDDVWLTAADSLEYTGTRLRLERFDSRTGRRVGTAVAVGNSSAGIRRYLGSLWVATPAGLVRLRATTPRPALRPKPPAAASPRPLVAGPLAQGTWRTTIFPAPFAISAPAFGWLVTYPEPDAVSFQGTGERFTELDFTAPLQVFSNDVALHAVRDPASLLRILQKNPRIKVSAVRHLTIGGVPAVRFEIRAREPVPHHPEICGPFPCVLLFPTHETTYAVAKGDVPTVSVLRVGGRTLVLWEGGDGADPVAFAAGEKLLRTAVFKQ